MLRAAATLVVVAIGLGGCSDNDESSGLYDFQASLHCFQALAPTQAPDPEGWRVYIPKPEPWPSGQTIYVTYTRPGSGFGEGSKTVDVFFAKSKTAAKTFFERRRMAGMPRRLTHRLVQHRLNVVLFWNDPEVPPTRRQIATVTGCLRSADK